MPELFKEAVVSGRWSVDSEKKHSSPNRQPFAFEAGIQFVRKSIAAYRWWITATLIACFSGCSVTHGPINLRLDDRVVRPPVAVVLFLVDGLDRQTMLRLAAGGRLPNLRMRFMEGGVCVEGAVACMPALTYPNLVSVMTGQVPGHHGILGNQWFDRETLQIQDYLTVPTYLLAGQDFNAPTIHEILDEQFTVNVQCPARRGMDRTADNWLLTGADWLLRTYTVTDARVGSDVAWVAKVSNEAGKWPVLSTFYFPGVDQLGHEYGSDSHSYVRAVVNADRQIGRVIDAITSARPARHTYFVLIADHGHIPFSGKQTVDLARCLEEGFGLRVRRAEINDGDPSKRADELEKYDAIVVKSGGRRVAVHLRGVNGWKSPPGQNRIDQILECSAKPMRIESERRKARLVDLPAVACVALKTQDGARIVTHGGEILIERSAVEGKRGYRVANGADLLGKVAGEMPFHFDPAEWHSSREWLAASIDSAWPDFVPQVVDMFDSPRAGDLVVFAAGEWALARGDEGGHGSCVAWDMRVPMYFAGPDLPAGAKTPCGRVVDTMPTILDLLGESGRLTKHPPIDGQSLLPELRGAASSRPVRSNPDADAQ